MSEERSVVPVQQGGLVFGQTNLSAANFIPPRVKITQAMSAERVSGLSKEGDFFNVLTSESYGPFLKFVPIQAFMNRVLLVRDEKRTKVEAALTAAAGGGKNKVVLSEGDGLKCRSLDMIQGVGEPGIECGACPLSQWGAGNVAPLCTEVYNVASLTELGDLIILQFQRSSAKTGKQVFSMLRFGGPGQPPWGRFYTAETHEETIKGKGTFAVPVVKKTPDVPPTELMKAARTWFGELSGLGPIDVTPVEDEEAESRGDVDDTEGDDKPF